MVEKINLLILCTGDNQYHDHDKIGLILKNILSVSDFNVFLSNDLNILLPEKIKEFDTIVLYAVNAKTSNDKINNLLNAIKGKQSNYKGNPIGFVGIHGVTTSFQDNYAYKEMIGASFISHPYFGPTYDFIIEDKTHFITKYINDFKLQDELYFFDIHSNFNILISCIYENIKRPIAWFKEYGKGRIFYLALGHDINQISNVNFQKLVINGIKWTSFLENN